VLAGPLKVTSDAALPRLSGLRWELDQVLSAYFLWRRGRPNCPGLATEVDGSVDFDAGLYNRVRRHRAECERCTQTHRMVANPASMFLAAPVRPVPAQIRHLVFDPLDGHTDRPPAALDAPAISAVAAFPPPVVSPDNLGDLDDLWEAAPAHPATTPAATGTPPAPRAIPVRRHQRRRRVAAYVTGGAAAALLMGGAVVQFGLSGDDDPTVVDSPLESPAVDGEDQDVRSLGPVPPSTSTTSTTTTTPETTATVPG
jgi:hypothetical protein